MTSAGSHTLAAAGGSHFILYSLELRENSKMSHSQKPTVRKPATKFAHLRKKMDQARLRTKTNNLRVRKSGNR
jgi:hypothetical protein